MATGLGAETIVEFLMKMDEQVTWKIEGIEVSSK